MAQSLLQQIQAPIEDFLVQLDAEYDALLKADDAAVKDALEHVARSHGKHIRPTLLALSSLLCGGTIPSSAVYYSVVLELLHGSSLIHDDVLDAADMRRGESTLNAVYGNHKAVLVGDYLLATQFYYGVKHCSKQFLLLLAKAAQQLTLGEIRQIDATRQPSLISEQQYYAVIDGKTTPLFSLAAYTGAIAVEADETLQRRMLAFGECIGRAFQIKDDIFDYYPSEDIGKPSGNDLREGKVTLPLIYAYNMLDEHEKKNVERWVEEAPNSNYAIEQLLQLAHTSGGIELAKNRLHKELDNARELLRVFPEGEALNALMLLLDYLAVRNK